MSEENSCGTGNRGANDAAQHSTNSNSDDGSDDVVTDHNGIPFASNDGARDESMDGQVGSTIGIDEEDVGDDDEVTMEDLEEDIASWPNESSDDDGDAGVDADEDDEQEMQDEKENDSSDGGDDDDEGEDGERGGLPEGLERSGVLSWEMVRWLFSAKPEDTGGYLDVSLNSKFDVRKYARRQAVLRLENDYDFLHLVDEAHGVDELRIYDPEAGYYKYDEPTGWTLDALLDKHLDWHYNTPDINEIEKQLKTRNKCPHDKLNAGEHSDPLVCVTNGVLNVNEMELVEGGHSPEYYFTNSLQTYWDADVDTSEIDEFMWDILEDQEKIDIVFEMLGDSLTYKNDYKWFGVWSGESGAGKSVLVNLAEGVHGEDRTRAESLHDLAETRWSSARLTDIGAHLNVDADNSARKIKEVELLKKMTAKDKASHEYKGSDKFDAKTYCKMIFVMNEMSVVKDTKGAISKRLVWVDFPFQFFPESDPDYDPDNDYHKKADPQIEEELLTEENLAAFLKRMVEGLARLREQGDFSWSVPRSQRLDHYNMMADPIMRTVVDGLDNSISHDEDGKPIWMSADELHTMVGSYAREEDISVPNKGTLIETIRRETSLELEEYWTEKENGKRGKVYKYVHPTAWGWQYAARSTRERFATEVDTDVEGLPAPGDNDDTPSGPQCNPEGFFGSLSADVAADGGRETFTVVVDIITRLNEESSSEASELAVLQACDEEGIGTRDTIDALDTLEEAGGVEQDDDGVYHVTEDLSGNEDEDDSDDGDDDDDEGSDDGEEGLSAAEEHILGVVEHNTGNEYQGPTISKPNVMVTANTPQYEADELLGAIDSLVESGRLERVDDEIAIAGGDE